MTPIPPIVTASSAATMAMSRRLSDKFVSDAEDSGDGIGAELLAEVLDVRVDGAVEPFEVVAHGQAGQLIAPEDASGRAGHRHQQAELRRGQIFLLAADGHLESRRID